MTGTLALMWALLLVSLVVAVASISPILMGGWVTVVWMPVLCVSVYDAVGLAILLFEEHRR